MNRTPRALNRVLLAVLGLVLVVIGAHLILVTLLPAYASVMAGPLGGVTGWIAGLGSAPAAGRTGLWLGIAVGAVVLLVLAAIWVMVQGRGRVTVFTREAVPSGPGRGVVEIAGAVPITLLKRALSEREDVVAVTVSAWDQRGPAAGLRVRIQPRHGAEPLPIAQDADQLVRTLDERIGLAGPVVVELVTGTRAKFATPQRVK